MSQLYMLDTDTASYIVKGIKPVGKHEQKAVTPSQFCISVITRAELLYGLTALPDKHPLHASVTRLLAEVKTLNWCSECAEHYAKIKRQLINTGKKIGEMDTMIAAHALASNSVLVTNNTRHFERVEPRLALENWYSYK